MAVQVRPGRHAHFAGAHHDVHSLRGYYLATSLFLFCGGFVNFLIAIGIGSLITFFPTNLAGVIYCFLRMAAVGAVARTARA